MPDVSHYGVHEMSVSERRESKDWYEQHNDEDFDNRLALENCQD
jgi:hypothetical protein